MSQPTSSGSGLFRAFTIRLLNRLEDLLALNGLSVPLSLPPSSPSKPVRSYSYTLTPTPSTTPGLDCATIEISLSNVLLPCPLQSPFHSLRELEGVNTHGTILGPSCIPSIYTEGVEGDKNSGRAATDCSKRMTLPCSRGVDGNGTGIDLGILPIVARQHVALNVLSLVNQMAADGSEEYLVQVGASDEGTYLWNKRHATQLSSTVREGERGREREGEGEDVSPRVAEEGGSVATSAPALTEGERQDITSLICGFLGTLDSDGRSPDNPLGIHFCYRTSPTVSYELVDGQFNDEDRAYVASACNAVVTLSEVGAHPLPLACPNTPFTDILPIASNVASLNTHINEGFGLFPVYDENDHPTYYTQRELMEKSKPRIVYAYATKSMLESELSWVGVDLLVCEEVVDGDRSGVGTHQMLDVWYSGVYTDVPVVTPSGLRKLRRDFVDTEFRESTIETSDRDTDGAGPYMRVYMLLDEAMHVMCVNTRLQHVTLLSRTFPSLTEEEQSAQLTGLQETGRFPAQTMGSLPLPNNAPSRVIPLSAYVKSDPNYKIIPSSSMSTRRSTSLPASSRSRRGTSLTSTLSSMIRQSYASHTLTCVVWGVSDNKGVEGEGERQCAMDKEAFEVLLLQLHSEAIRNHMRVSVIVNHSPPSLRRSVERLYLSQKEGFGVCVTLIEEN
ncbi:hypothetical protein KIPB_006265 [Kipferlia bialata]|uniref:Uncharacterized protein n=1 Tax=Kipferlia bialata TaxID=797122 RepID=A0A9K3GJ47_9EUKA|nr:hypothetical protein KIPB_006265 [Kipferlia bialata]|eukprot:g6265.t1